MRCASHTIGLLTTSLLSVATPITLHIFNITANIGLLGSPSSDIFYVALQTPYTAIFTKTTKYSNAIFKVDMNIFSSKAGILTSAPTVSHILDIPKSIFLNGMDTLDSSHIPIGDSTSVQVYNLDISTPIPSYATPLKLSSMAIPPNAGTQLGVDGIHYRHPFLYFDNL
ncbi:hypothetical protein OCU04_012339 [Sclerotinia nivalis]|uniref:Uncharacterized protein n=1 Tax=Sclerotinia nivalis TaxID=352851 RepID=A0A9X0DG16_9HELO|nr:hypothetical protein OCU04_012339 [Sclerotinia nivalis]